MRQQKVVSFRLKGEQQLSLCGVCFKIRSHKKLHREKPVFSASVNNKVRELEKLQEVQEVQEVSAVNETQEAPLSTHSCNCQTYDGVCETTSDRFWTSTLTLSLEQEAKNKWKTCESCKRTLYLTGMSKAQIWRGQWYCHYCYDQYFQSSFLQNKSYLQQQLLLRDNVQGRCSLCLHLVDMEKDDTIFEHMNPFQKENEITQLLRQGEKNCCRVVGEL